VETGKLSPNIGFALLDCCRRRQALHIPISGPVVEIDIL
jgi:hypothetical protein